MALNKGKKIVMRSWDVIPMPDTVITLVNALVSDQPEQLILPIDADIQSETSKSQEWTHLTPTILIFQEWIHQTLTLTISRSQEWMWTFKIHKLLILLIPTIH